MLPELIPLWKHQRQAVEKAMTMRDYALLFDLGAGKTATMVNILRHRYKEYAGVRKTLILAPIIVVPNRKREIAAHSKIPADKVNLLLGPGSKRVAALKKIIMDNEHSIVVTNFEALTMKEVYALLMRWRPEIIVADECFSADTLIDTPTGAKKISTLKAGDKIINCTGIDEIEFVAPKKVLEFLEIKTNDGKIINCSFNHPFFTAKGWVNAINLKEGDYLVKTNQAMRIMRKRFYTNKEEKVLRKILLSEMANGPTRNKKKCLYRKNSRENFQGIDWEKESKIIRTSQNQQSYVQQRKPRKNEENAYRYGPQTYQTWREWPWAYRARKIIDPKSWQRCYLELRNTIREISGKRIPNLLQSRFSLPKYKTFYRGRRCYSLLTEKSRYKKRQEISAIRVENIEIKKSVHSERFSGSTFYDLTIKKHPSYSVNGILVHNCQRIKNAQAKRTKLAIALGDYAKHRSPLS